MLIAQSSLTERKARSRSQCRAGWFDLECNSQKGRIYLSIWQCDVSRSPLNRHRSKGRFRWGWLRRVASSEARLKNRRVLERRSRLIGIGRQFSAEALWKSCKNPILTWISLHSLERCLQWEVRQYAEYSNFYIFETLYKYQCEIKLESKWAIFLLFLRDICTFMHDTIGFKLSFVIDRIRRVNPKLLLDRKNPKNSKYYKGFFVLSLGW